MRLTREHDELPPGSRVACSTARMIWGCALAIGCGPVVPGDGDAGGEAGSGSAGSDAADQTSSAEETIGEILDVTAGAPAPTELCGLEIPGSCTPTWGDDVDMNVDPWTSGVSESSEGWLDVQLNGSQSGSPEYLWHLGGIVMPCWTLPRTQTIGTLTVSVHAGWEYSLFGEYQVGVDIELLNPCAHVQLHEIHLQPQPDDLELPDHLDPSDLVPTGIAYVQPI